MRDRRKLGIGVVVAAALTIILFGDLTPGEPIPAVDCPFEAGDLGVRVTCYQIPVGTGSILATVLHRGSRPLDSAPVLVLGEEPGATPSFDLARHASMSLLAHRDLVLVDPLGSDRTSPSLDCGDLDLTRVESLTLCRDQLIDADSLEGHSTLDLVEHLVAVREQLRLGRSWRAWHVVGRGYGAQLALQLAAADEGGVDSMVLSAAAPIGVPSLIARAEAYPSSIAALQAECSLRAGCGGLRPLEETSARVIHRLASAAEPVEVVADGDRRTAVQVGDGDFLAALSYGLQTPTIPGMLPWAVARIDDGASEFGLESGARDTLAGLVSATGDRPTVDRLLWWNTVCSEQIAQVATDVLASLTNGMPGMVAPADPIAVCNDWPLSPRRPESVLVDTPTVFLDAETDPIGTGTWTERVADATPGATIVPVTQAEWIPGSSDCSARLVNGFFTEPDQTPEPGCLADPIGFAAAPVPVGEVRQVGRTGQTAAMTLGTIALLLTIGATAWIWLGSPGSLGRSLWIGVGAVTVVAFLGTTSVMALSSAPARLIAQPGWTWAFFVLPWLIPVAGAVAIWATIRDVAAHRLGGPWPARYGLLAAGVLATLTAMVFLGIVPGI